MSKTKEILKNIFFTLFIWIFRRKIIDQKIYFSNPAKILLLQFKGKQDALNVTPLIKILKENYNCNLTLLCTSENNAVFVNNSYVNNIIIYERGINFLTKTIFNLRKAKYDVIFDCHETENDKSTLAVGLIRSRNKVGFNTKNHNLLTHRIDQTNKFTTHIVDRLLNLTESLEMNFTKSDLNIFYQTSQDSKERIRDYFINHNLGYNMTVVINISNDNSIGFWGVENFNRLLKYLRNYDINVIIAASIDDIEVAESIAQNKYLIFYNTDFDIYSELLSKVNFIFSPDSFTVQLSAAFKVPVFCLFAQNKETGMMNVPYNSDFDFVSTENKSLSSISFGQTLNSFVPYFEYIYEKYQSQKNSLN